MSKNERTRVQISRLIMAFVAIIAWSVHSYASDVSEKRLLVIDSQVGDPYQTVRESMLDSLAAKGYNEAAGFTHEYYSLSHYHGAAISLWRHRIQKVQYDAIFLNGTLAVSSFKQIAWKSEQHPFIFASVTDPEGLGLIDAFDTAPPENFTGVAYRVPVEDRLKFVKRLIPNVKNIGLVYADMPQSHSYRGWLDALMKKKEWAGVKLHYRQVDFIPSEGGHRRMAQMAKAYVEELDPIVDVFLSPNDQMGAQRPFAEMVEKTATKPLIGVGRHEVAENWGAVASIYPDEGTIGAQAAEMVARLLEGENISTIHPQRSAKLGVIIDATRAERFGLKLASELLDQAEIIRNTPLNRRQ